MTVLLAFMTAIGPVTIDIYLASLPYISDALDASTAAVQLTLSFYLIGFAFGQIFYGPLSDSYGRRPMLLLAFALYLVATCVCALARSIEVLIAARVVQAIGAAGPVILARAIVRDLHEGARAARQLGLMSTIMGVTPIGAPVLGGFLQAWFGWRASFVAMGFLGLALMLSALLFLPETNTARPARNSSARGVLGSFAAIAQSGVYRSYLAMQALIYIGVFAFLSGSPHVLQTLLGLSSIEFGFSLSFCTLGYIAGNFVGTRLVSGLGLEGMIRLGKNVVLAGALSQVAGYLCFPGHFMAIIVPQMMYFLGAGYMVPQLMAGALTPFPDRAGAASSLMGFVQMTSAALVAAIMNACFGDTAWPLVVVTSLAAAAIFCVFHATLPQRRS